MKYLFIFLPFFTFGQGDTSLYSVRYDSIITHRAYPDTCWEIKNGWMSLKPGCATIPSLSASGAVINFSEFYVSNRKPKVVEPFRNNGSYYELRENEWYKEILPDTLPPGTYKNSVDYSSGSVKIKGDSVFKWSESKWFRCDQHIGTRDIPKRDKIDRTRVRVLVWNGCALEEIEAYKITHYNEMTVAKNTGGLAVYISETIKVDIATEYLYDGGWIKNSHVIKEL